MTTLGNLLRGICEHPADTHRRLVYADACEDAGDVDRATFIRVQCKIAACGMRRCAKTGEPVGWYNFTSRCRCEACALRRLEYMSSRRHVVWDWSARECYWEKYRRGFVEVVRYPAPVWERIGASIVCEHPITQVEFSDLPDRWTNGKPYISSADIPQGIWLALAAFSERARDAQAILYANQEAMRDALSAAAITWARRTAGLDVACEQCQGKGHVSPGKLLPAGGFDCTCPDCQGKGWRTAES